VQLERASATVMRDIFIIVVAGLLLGFLFEGTLEGVRCDAAALNPLLGKTLFDPTGAHNISNFTFAEQNAQNWALACKNQLWSDRSWFERPAWFCSSDVLPSLPPYIQGDLLDRIDELKNIEPSMFDGVRLGYMQALTLCLLAMAIISIQVSLNLFGAERPVFWRESRHFSIIAYLLGKNLAFLPLTLAYPFFFLLFFYQLLRPYAPFQAFYAVFVLVEWAGEGIGQLISLQLNSARQLAGGIAALIFTVLTGSFPLLSGMGVTFEVISYASFCRWGMQALLSLEFTPWYVGNAESYAVNAEGHTALRGCCTLDYHSLGGIFQGQPLPSRCASSCVNETALSCTGFNGHMPTSNDTVWDVLVGGANGRANTPYGYGVSGLDWGCPDCFGSPDVFPPHPTPHGVMRPVAPPAGYTPADMRFSQTALVMLVLIGVVSRMLVYVTLRLADRDKRR